MTRLGRRHAPNKHVGKTTSLARAFRKTQRSATSVFDHDSGHRSQSQYHSNTGWSWINDSDLIATLKRTNELGALIRKVPVLAAEVNGSQPQRPVDSRMGMTGMEHHSTGDRQSTLLIPKELPLLEPSGKGSPGNRLGSR